MKKGIICIISFLFMTMPIWAQNQNYSIIGKVYGENCIISDSVEVTPLSHAYIQIKEFPKQGWITDVAGYFKIDSLPPKEYHLTFSFVGLEACDTTVIVNKDVKPLTIKLPLYEQPENVAPMMILIVSGDDDAEINKSPFWDKYGLRTGRYTKEGLRKGGQEISIVGYSYMVAKNQKIFEYMDKKFGYNWRFEAPKGIIGLDETLDYTIEF